jgi:O-antigen/teichoic acid export membrane protein
VLAVLATRRSATVSAVGLAAAAMAANAVAVVSTVVFARMLGTDGYGALAALLNLSVILFVPGLALQVAAAREGALGRLGAGGELAATVARWRTAVLVATVVVACAAVLARGPLAALLNVDEEWAAAAVPVTGCLWLLLCLQRGLLQATRAYRAAGLSIVLEATGRLATGVLLAAVGLGVTGAYLGTAASITVAALVLDRVLRRRLGPPVPDARPHPLGALARDAAMPIAVLTLLASLQNVDVIMARHGLDETAAGVYAACTVAAKALVWVAIGLGMWVLPEAARHAADGLDARTVLLRALAIIGALAVCALAVFAAVPGLLLRTAFGPDYETGAGVLLTLGCAYALLAASYLAVQFLLGVAGRTFALVLAAIAVAEPLLLLAADSLRDFATVVLGVQAAGAVVLLGFGLARRPLAAAPVA